MQLEVSQPQPAAALRKSCVHTSAGTGGLGLEICIAMAESGADVVSIHLPGDPGQKVLETEVYKTGRKIEGFECDVGNSLQIRATFEQIWNRGLVPDILLNCAGLNRRGPIEETTDENLDLVCTSNDPENFRLIESRSFP